MSTREGMPDGLDETVAANGYAEAAEIAEAHLHADEVIRVLTERAIRETSVDSSRASLLEERLEDLGLCEPGEGAREVFAKVLALTSTRIDSETKSAQNCREIEAQQTQAALGE